MEKNYIEQFKWTKMYEIMTKSIYLKDEMKVIQEKLMKSKEREHLKEFADIMAGMGMKDWQVLLKDISHWQRYLEHNIDKPLDFYEYIEWKYTNPENLTY